MRRDLGWYGGDEPGVVVAEMTVCGWIDCLTEVPPGTAVCPKCGAKFVATVPVIGVVRDLKEVQ